MSNTIEVKNNSSASLLVCTHCDETVVVPLFNSDDSNQSHPFCCQGCMTVYNVIHQKGLNDYYDIKNSSGLFKRRAPVSLKEEKYNYLDANDFLTDYAYTNSQGEYVMEFYLEGIHCLACLWLIEKLPEFLSDVKQSRLDMNKSVAVINLNKDGKFSHVARELNNLGYRPHPLKRNEEIEKLRRKEDRSNLLKIGIAGAASGNIMVYSVSIYAGADGEFLRIFSWMTVILAIPVILYSAIPFYKSAWSAIKNKTLNIDVPIALALIIGFFHGIFNILTHGGANYFDTLTDLVFLLLLSRYLLAKIQEKGLTATDLNFFYQTTSVKKINLDNTIEEIHPKFLKENDIIEINSMEMIPVDGVVVTGRSTINNSLLTGESLPVTVESGSEVFSGTQNIDKTIQIKVLKTNKDTRLGNILKEVESGWIQKAKIVEFTNRISKYFIGTVFIIALIISAYFIFQGQPKLAIERSLALLIITCPCALALATPLTLTNTLSRASKKGIIIKNDEVIEKLSEINEIYLDKTGTITFGNLKIENFQLHSNPNDSIWNIIATLEQKSVHPVAKALKDFAAENGEIKLQNIENYKEIIGIGVEGFINNHFYEIKNSKIFCDHDLIASFSLKDQVRPDSKSAIQILNKLNITTHMISGDNKAIALEVGEKIGMDKSKIHSEVTPEKKLNLIEATEKALMIGDGANDAMALSKAYVGVAVCGSMDISLRAADVYLTTPGIYPLVDLVIISKETMKIIYRNLSISVIYNIISVICVFMGIVSPLLAAIIMPLSSISVVISTLIGTKQLNQRLK